MDWTWLKVLGFSAGGGVITLAGFIAFSRWFGDKWFGWLFEKQKARYARELEDLKADYAQELEHYRAQLERSTFVTRAHFETELDAYKRVFEGLGEVSLAIAGTRPMMGITPENDTEEQKIKRLAARTNLLLDAHDKTLKVIEHLSPFYPQDIYLKLGACLAAARGEILDIQTGGAETFSVEWVMDGTKRREVFFPAYNAAVEAIRARIASMAIIPR